MKCPLLTDKNYGAQLERTMASGDCIKEECAWWDKACLQCVLVAIHYRLATISGSLMGIAKELTMLRPRGG